MIGFVLEVVLIGIGIVVGFGAGMYYKGKVMKGLSK